MCDVDHSTPPTTEVKNEWREASTPTICLHGWDRASFYNYLEGVGELI